VTRTSIVAEIAQPDALATLPGWLTRRRTPTLAEPAHRDGRRPLRSGRTPHRPGGWTPESRDPPLALLVVIAATLIASGLNGFRRRDIGRARGPWSPAFDEPL
jgi:hypothetical protein